MITPSNFKMKPRYQSSTKLKFLKPGYQSGKLTKTFTMEISIEKPPYNDEKMIEKMSDQDHYRFFFEFCQESLDT